MLNADQPPATLTDLYRTRDKAELIRGKIVYIPALGHLPSTVAGQIACSLYDYATRTGKGEVFTGKLTYAIPELPSGRESFSPDASYYDGPLPENPMSFIEGPSTFAVEVRSENDYGPAAEAEMADKRADYFAAGTKAIWDVDPLAECIHVYKASNPGQPQTYHRGQTAEAEPAVPG